MPKCFQCPLVFVDYHALALHISSSRKGHRKGKRWAAKFLFLNKLSPDKKRNGDHMPLTEQDRTNKVSSIRELSGAYKTVATYCLKCKQSIQQSVPIEYAESPDAWQTKSGTLIMDCLRCQNNIRYKRQLD